MKLENGSQKLCNKRELLKKVSGRLQVVRHVSSNLDKHKQALALFLTAFMVATVFGIIGTAADTPHGVANAWYAKGAVVAPSKSNSSIAASVSHAGRNGKQEQNNSKFHARALGMAPKDIVGKTWKKLGIPLEPMRRVTALADTVFATGRSKTGELRWDRTDGTVQCYEYVHAPIFD